MLYSPGALLGWLSIRCGVRMLYITAVRLQGGHGHDHIAMLQWEMQGSGKSGSSTTASMVEWIEAGNVAKVRGRPGSSDSTVGVVKSAPPHLRTYADGEWNNNLLALPRF